MNPSMKASVRVCVREEWACNCERQLAWEQQKRSVCERWRQKQKERREGEGREETWLPQYLVSGRKQRARTWVMTVPRLGPCLPLPCRVPADEGWSTMPSGQQAWTQASEDIPGCSHQASVQDGRLGEHTLRARDHHQNDADKLIWEGTNFYMDKSFPGGSDSK